ncbi:MAG: hypothetical protein RR872_05705 [Mucinivorans sp.]
MDNELLKRLLAENSRIIIPGFGAFLRKDQGGALVFSPFLRTDDGKLNAIVAVEYGVSVDEAKGMIAEFAERVRTILKVKSKYYIDDLGMLMVDNNGVISFVAQAPRPVVAPASAPIVEQPQPQAMMPSVSPITSRPAPLRAQPMGVPTPSPFARPTSPIAPIPAPIPSPISTPRPAPMPQRPPQPISPRPAAAPNHNPQPKPRPKPSAIHSNPKSKQNDMWLIIAIVAAAVVIVLMIFGIINTSQMPPIE